jgi:hypothetical protein
MLVPVIAVIGQVPLTVPVFIVKPARVIPCPTTHGRGEAKFRVKTVVVSLPEIGVIGAVVEALVIVPI